jgi:hypothetical protein
MDVISTLNIGLKVRRGRIRVKRESSKKSRTVADQVGTAISTGVQVDTVMNMNLALVPKATLIRYHVILRQHSARQVETSTGTCSSELSERAVGHRIRVR